MKRLIHGFRISKSIIGIGTLTVLLGTTYFVQDLSSNLKRVGNFGDGLHTCFARVKQSYTAKVIGDVDSTYLDQSFVTTTEECFSEAIALAAQLPKTLEANAKRVNNLASDTHWFHERLDGERNDFVAQTPEDVVMANLSTRFEKLENNYDQAVESIDSFKGDLIESLALAKLASFILGILTLALFGWDYAERRRLWMINKDLEAEALAEMEGEEAPEEDKVIGILSKVLGQNGLINCSQLLTRYQSLVKATRTPAPRYQAPVQAFATDDASKNADEMERVWNESDRIEIRVPEDTGNLQLVQTEPSNPVVEEESYINPDLQVLNLDKSLSRVVSMLSQKFFTKGILFDLDVDEDINILAKDESLEHVFFQLLNNAIGACDYVATKRVSIVAKKLGGSAVVDVIDSGIGFSDDFIRGHIGLIKETDQLGIGLKICNEFMKEFGGQMSFENLKADNGMISGGKVKLLFKQAPRKRSGRLVSLKKGSKREILNQFQTL